MEWAVFILFAVAALAGSAGVILARRPVHAALFLVLTLFCMAVFFVMQSADFLAAVQVIVYAGAVVVLFLFVIMLLGVESEDLLEEPLPAQRPLAVVVGLAMIAGLLLAADALQPTGATAQRGEAVGQNVSNVENVARSLFTDFLWPFEITSILLVIAVVGSIVLARRGGPVPGGTGVSPEMPGGTGVSPEMPAGAGVSPEMPAGAGVSPEMPAGAGMSSEKPAGAGVSPRTSAEER